MKALPYSLLALSLLTLVYTTASLNPTPEKWDKMLAPSEHFFLQRAYPDTAFDLLGYEQAMHIARREHTFFTSNRSSTNEWVAQGPGNIGGRINAIAIHPTQPDTMYVGSASGGVHKTLDGGQTWTPIFDDFSYLAIGAIALDPSNPETVYVGTGDPNITGYPFIGDGVYKSTDGGQSWTHLGLTDQRIVSRILVDPANPNKIFVATMGLPFLRNNDRGLYRSLDGGQTWTEVLFVSNQAGVVDLIMDPFNSNVLYAASWDRIRNNEESTVNGPGAGIWKSVDGGTNWTLLSGGLPTLPQGRIGLAISHQTPNLLFAIYVGTNNNLQGVYKSTNAGISWTNVSGDLDPTFLGSFGWYFGQIRVSPDNDNELWVMGVQLYRSQNGGLNWNMADPDWWTYEVHADKHDLQFAPNGEIFLATDGGLYKTVDDAANWIDVENIPNTQFYRVAVNPHNPTYYYGGTQDNGSIGGNATSFNSWERIYGGDGFQMRFDPDNANVFYAETQYGGLNYTADGGANWANHRQGIAGERRNWDMPFLLSAFDPLRHYTGTYRVYRVENGGGNTWFPISPDLTDGLIFGNTFHTISAIDESPQDSNILYAGTSDGNVWVSTDFGSNWNNISQTLPDRYVTSVIASPTDSSAAFVAHSGYKYNEFFPHIHKSSDYGASWTDISGNLPPLAINDICAYPTDDDILFVATDGGVYGTQDGGANWSRIGDNMPMVIVYDLEIEPTTQTLIAGTHGRSLMTYDLGQFLLAQPVVTASGPIEFCEGDSVTLSAPAGFAGYLWTTGDTTQTITISQSGTFQVLVLNADGSSSPQSLGTTVTVNPIPPQPLISGANLLCEGDSLTIQGPSGYATYYWNGQAGGANWVVKDSGTYTLQVESAEGCLSAISEPLQVDIQAPPVAAFSLTPLSDSTLSFNNLSQEGTNYLWDFGDGNSSTDANPIHTYTNGAVDLTISLIVSNACGSDTFTTYYAGTVDLPGEANFPLIRVYPVPANDIMWVQVSPSAAGNLTLWDTGGREVLQQSFSNTQGNGISLRVADLPDGQYILSILTDQQPYFQKVIIRH